MNAELRHAELELLSAQCATDRLRLRYSAEDAFKLGFDSVVIESATRAIDLDGSAEATRHSFRRGGISLVPHLS